METNQYMDMFLDESREHLQSLNDGLLSLENDPNEVSVVNEIFRNAHTLKGMSATMGFNKIAELTHEMEDVLDLIRNNQLKVTEDIIETIFKCLDSLQEMIENVGNGDPEDLVDVSDLVKKLSSISKGEPQPAADAAPAAAEAPAAEAAPASSLDYTEDDKDAMRAAKQGGMVVFHIHIRLADTCLLKAARTYMVMNALDEIGDVIKSVPSTEDLEAEKFDHDFDLVLVTTADAHAVSDALAPVSELEEVKIEEVDPDNLAAPAPAPAGGEARRKAGGETCREGSGEAGGRH